MWKCKPIKAFCPQIALVMVIAIETLTKQYHSWSSGYVGILKKSVSILLKQCLSSRIDYLAKESEG